MRWGAREEAAGGLTPQGRAAGWGEVRGGGQLEQGSQAAGKTVWPGLRAVLEPMSPPEEPGVMPGHRSSQRPPPQARCGANGGRRGGAADQRYSVLLLPTAERGLSRQPPLKKHVPGTPGWLSG